MARPKSRTFTIDLPLYKTELLVCAGVPMSEWHQCHGKAFNAGPPDEDEDTEACVFRLDPDRSKVCCMWFRDRRPGVSVIAHESLHVAHTILKVVGFHLSDESEEAYTYLVEYLVTEVLRGLLRR